MFPHPNSCAKCGKRTDKTNCVSKRRRNISAEWMRIFFKKIGVDTSFHK